MTEHIALLDWAVIAVYLVGLVVFALWLSRDQNSREDYYVGGRNIGAWPIAISIMATQCSTNSILGAPAFVGFTEGGGLLWLQYELAVPLAMLVLVLVFVPKFKQLQLVSIYAYLEGRFDVQTRLLLSGLFLFVRAFATAVTVYSIAIVVDLITGVGFFWSVVLLGVFTVVYDVLGGMRGVVYSDVLQMIILVAVLVLVLVTLVIDVGGVSAILQNVDTEKLQTIDFSHHGLGDGYSFSFWPMMLGGLFLYVAYYGCDQSQMQRVLSTKNAAQANKALVINGFLRFPLVALYCFVGIALAAFAAQSPEFLQYLPQTDGEYQYNLVVPTYIIQTLPQGLVGLGLVALFAAAMSSLDSVINSLSATTMEDFVRPYFNLQNKQGVEIQLSRLITVAWGTVTLAMAFYVGDIAPTVLEAINKVGSLANGPILAVFIAGFCLPYVKAIGVKTGLFCGVLCNALCWLYLPSVSWLWWNVFGCLVTLAVALFIAALHRTGPGTQPLTDTSEELNAGLAWHSARNPAVILMTGFAVLFSCLLWLNTL